MRSALPIKARRKTNLPRFTFCWGRHDTHGCLGFEFIRNTGITTFLPKTSPNVSADILQSNFLESAKKSLTKKQYLDTISAKLSGLFPKVKSFLFPKIAREIMSGHISEVIGFGLR